MRGFIKYCSGLFVVTGTITLVVGLTVSIATARLDVPAKEEQNAGSFTWQFVWLQNEAHRSANFVSATTNDSVSQYKYHIIRIRYLLQFDSSVHPYAEY